MIVKRRVARRVASLEVALVSLILVVYILRLDSISNSSVDEGRGVLLFPIVVERCGSVSSGSIEMT
jgi:hypothetical protein